MIYIVHAVGTPWYKIGVADDSPKRLPRRLTELQTGCPLMIRLVTSFPGGQGAEKSLHHKYHHKRGIGEWFALSGEDIDAIVGMEHSEGPRLTASIVHSALSKSGGNRRRAAELLDIHPRTIYKKMKEYGITG